MDTNLNQQHGGEKQKFDPNTDKRIHEILNNEEDTVSEDDIKNIRTDVVNTVNTYDSSITGEEKVKDDTDPAIDNTSWNVLQGDN